MRLVTAPANWAPVRQLTTQRTRDQLLLSAAWGTSVQASWGRCWRNAWRNGEPVWRRLSRNSMERYAIYNNNWISNTEVSTFWIIYCIIYVVCVALLHVRKCFQQSNIHYGVSCRHFIHGTVYLLLNQMWTVVYNCSPFPITLNLALTFVTDLYRTRLNLCRLQIGWIFADFIFAEARNESTWLTT